MTKLKLNLAQGAGEILSREELKKVLGGTGSGSDGSGKTQHCVVKCYDYDNDPKTTITDVGSSCPTTTNYGCTTKYYCCNCSTY